MSWPANPSTALNILPSGHRDKAFRRILVLFFLFILPARYVSSQPFFGDMQLTDASKVSLITIGPGDELYSGFGHSVLWIADPATGIDRAYNYGTFSFQSENFYIKFLRGTLPYELSVLPLGPQAFEWRLENRSIKEQELNLSLDQRQRLLEDLERNYLPENRKYHYRFFYDNCSSRLQEVLRRACGDSLIYHGYTKEARSFRSWIDLYAFKQKPWADFGMDLAIGAPADVTAGPLQATFLPDNLSSAFADTKITTRDGVFPLVKSERMLFEPVTAPQPSGVTPTVFFWGLAVLVGLLTWWQLKKGSMNFVFDRILFSVVGLTGWVILALWFGTDHGVTSYNWDILWAFPLWIPLVFRISGKRKRDWFQVFLIVYAVLLICSTANLEKHNLVLIPILVILTMRVYYLNNSLFKISKKANS